MVHVPGPAAGIARLPTPVARPTLRSLVLLLALLAGCGEAPHGSADVAAVPPPSDTLIPVGGTELFVHLEGVEGEPLVVVHGGPLLDHGHLVAPLRPLADRYRLIFYDQRLSGRSAGSVDSASVTLATFAEDIDGIRQALGLDRIHLFGHSWGGLIAMTYAVRHPDRLRSLVLVSPMPPSTGLWQREQEAQQAALEPTDTAGMGTLRSSPEVAAGDPAAIERLLRLSFRSQLHDPGLADSLRFHIPVDYGERSRQFAFLMDDLMAYDLVPRLRALDAPTLVVHGTAETGARATADTLAATLSDVHVVAIEEAGHFAFLERQDAFLRAVRAFLRDAGR